MPSLPSLATPTSPAPPSGRVTAPSTPTSLQAILFPWQLIFVPNSRIQQMLPQHYPYSTSAEYYEQLLYPSLSVAGELLYYVFALDRPGEQAFLVGDLLATTNFYRSDFGDRKLFFKHTRTSTAHWTAVSVRRRSMRARFSSTHRLLRCVRLLLVIVRRMCCIGRSSVCCVRWRVVQVVRHVRRRTTASIPRGTRSLTTLQRVWPVLQQQLAV